MPVSFVTLPDGSPGYEIVLLARALDLELALVPRKYVLAITAITRPKTRDGNQARLKAFNRATAALAKLRRAHADGPDVKRLEQTIRDLTNLQLTSADLVVVQRIMAELSKVTGSAMPSGIQTAAQALYKLRNRIVHAVPERPQPAYALDEDEDA